MEAIQKVTAVQQAADRLHSYILDDNVHIGDRLPTEKRICEELQIGRGTAREALRILQAQGYLDLQPGRGAYVRSKTRQTKSDISSWFEKNEVELQELMTVRCAIEPLAVGLAIAQCTDEDISALDQIHARSIDAAKKHDAVTLGSCDEEFHTLIFQYAGNRFLLEIHNIISAHLRDFRKNTFTIRGNVDNFIPAHDAILKAFHQRDEKMGERKMRQHMDKVVKDLMTSKTNS